MKIILANPVKSHDKADVLGYPNIGLLSLISYIRKNMKDEVQFKYIETMSFDKHIRLIEEIRPDVYGLSFASYTLTYKINPYKLIDEIKKIQKNKAIFLILFFKFYFFLKFYFLNFIF